MSRQMSAEEKEILTAFKSAAAISLMQMGPGRRGSRNAGDRHVLRTAALVSLECTARPTHPLATLLIISPTHSFDTSRTAWPSLAWTRTFKTSGRGSSMRSLALASMWEREDKCRARTCLLSNQLGAPAT